MAPAIFTFLFPHPSDICSLREHAGVEGSFQMNLKKRFDNSSRVNKALLDLYT